MVIAKLFIRSVKRFIESGIDKIIQSLPVYYNDLNRIKLARWFDILEGKYIKLYKIRLTKRVPLFFYETILDMTFQNEHVDLTELQRQADLAILYSMAARTENKSILFQADSMAKEIENKAKKQERKGMKLNEFIDFIEITFEQIATIDPEKITAGRAFSLYHKAIEKNKRLAKMYEKK